MGEYASNPEDYYSANHGLLIDTAASISRLVGTAESVMIVQGTTGRLSIESGAETETSMRERYRATGTEPPEALDADTLASVMNDALEGAATEEMRLTLHWLTAAYDEQSDFTPATVLPPYEEQSEPMHPVQPEQRTWQHIERTLPDGTPVTLSRTTFYSAEAYERAVMCRATIHDSDMATDTFITIVDGYSADDRRPVHAQMKYVGDDLLHVPADSRPSASQLADLRDRLADAE